ncbi:MAG: DUF2007 domain-containing protein [Candidatus Competibacteraceae bacterium]|nr:DUF2007 domain-containing protein [Candidatus Competibacteraceae bacterium]
MVTIARFDFLPQAAIARGRLLAEGIDCRLADQHLVQTDWLYSIAVGGIKLQVEAQDAERAQVILNHDYSADLDSESAESDESP